MAKPNVGKSGEKGIHKKKDGKYEVQVCVGGMVKCGGRFTTEAAAKVKRDELRVEQAAARKKKAATNPVKRKAPPRPDLGMVTHHGITTQRKKHPAFTLNMSKNKKKYPVPKPKHILAFERFFMTGMAAVSDSSLLYLWRQTPLAAKGGTLRGAIGELIVKKLLADRGDDVREREHESHDLIRVVNGEKELVEVKLARMSRGANSWLYRAKDVKQSLFDELYLVFEGASGVYVYTWGGEGYIGTEHAQRAASGGAVVVCGDEGVLDPDAAEAALLRNFKKKNNVLIGVARYDDPAFAALFARSTTTEHLFSRVPLGTLQATVRGDALEAMVAEVLTTLGCSVTLPTPGERTNGDNRGKQQAECDRLVDGVRSEIKSSVMVWIEGTCPHFHLVFAGVKAAQHEDRYLVWMSPWAVHIFKQPHGNTAGLCGTGATREISFRAPSGRDEIKDPKAAETFLLQKLAFHGLEYLARLDIAPGDFEAYEAAIAARRV